MIIADLLSAVFALGAEHFVSFVSPNTVLSDIDNLRNQYDDHFQFFGPSLFVGHFLCSPDNIEKLHATDVVTHGDHMEVLRGLMRYAFPPNTVNSVPSCAILTPFYS